MKRLTLTVLLYFYLSSSFSQELFEVDSVWLYPFANQIVMSSEKAKWLSQHPSGHMKLAQRGILASMTGKCGTHFGQDSTFFQFYFSNGMQLTGYEYDANFYLFDSKDSIHEVIFFSDEERDKLWGSCAFLEQLCQVKEKYVSGIVLGGNFQGGRNLNISPDAPNAILKGNLFDDGEVNFNVHFKAFLDGLAEYFKQHPEMSFEIISSPENYAPERHSQLGQRRTQTIISYMIEKGCDADQLVPFGYGHGAPLISKSKDLELGEQDWFIIRLLYVDEKLEQE